MGTSFVQTEQDKDLRRRMRRAGIFEKDLKETFVHSSGPGGQNVNKVATCVTLQHGPTGISVKCQVERTQRQNRYQARVILLEKVSRLRLAEARKAEQLREKVKRQNRKRSRRAKETMLEDKHRQSDKKQKRRKVRLDKEQDY